MAEIQLRAGERATVLADGCIVARNGSLLDRFAQVVFRLRRIWS